MVCSGCTPAPDLPIPAAPAADPGLGLGPLAVVELRLGPVPAGPRGVELAGLVTVLTEAGLADLAETQVRIADAPQIPGVADALRTDAESWTGDLVLTLIGPKLEVQLGLCQGERCEDATGEGTAAEPWLAVADLLDRAAFVLGRSAVGEASAGWRHAPSPDPYAVLMAGRAAATFYGLRPRPGGSKRSDPLGRALFLDPGMPHPWWLQGREQLAADPPDPAEAARSFARAVLSRPQSPAFVFAEAVALQASDKRAVAADAWLELAEQLPGDPRVALPAARAQLAVDRPDVAAAVLDALHPRHADDPTLLALRVDIAGSRGVPDVLDAALRAWAKAAPDDPEPMRRLVARHVSEARYEQALEAALQLGARGAADESLGLRLALATELGRWDEAADAARTQGLTEVAEALRPGRPMLALPGSALPVLQ